VGVWSVQPWGNDEAADWFASFFRDLDIDALRAAFKYYDAWGEIRAACYVLQSLGYGSVWPTDRLEDLKELLDLGIAHLEKMLNPPDQSWDYLELWGHDPEVIAALQQQLSELQERRDRIF
jgi:hypothetical protein